MCDYTLRLVTHCDIQEVQLLPFSDGHRQHYQCPIRVYRERVSLFFKVRADSVLTGNSHRNSHYDSLCSAAALDKTIPFISLMGSSLRVLETSSMTSASALKQYRGCVLRSATRPGAGPFSLVMLCEPMRA